MLDETSFVGRGVGDVTVDEEGDDLAAELRRGSRLDRISVRGVASVEGIVLMRCNVDGVDWFPGFHA